MRAVHNAFSRASGIINSTKRRAFLKCLALLIAIMLCGAAALAESVLTLPANLKSIEAQAFAGDTSFDRVVLGSAIETIGAKAFAGSGLKSIFLPESLKSIASDAFDPPEKVSISAVKGSYAYDWAVKHGYIREDGSDPAADITPGMSSSALFEAIDAKFDSLMTPWLDEEGYTKAEDAPIASRTFYEWAKELQEQGILQACTYNADGNTVAISYDGVFVVYAQNIRDTFSGDQNVYSTFMLQSLTGGEYSHDIAFAHGYKINKKFVKHAGAPESAELIHSELSDRYANPIKAEGSACTIPALRTFIGGLAANKVRAVLWSGHGGTYTDEDGAAYIMWGTTENCWYDMVSNSSYADDLANHRIVPQKLPRRFGRNLCVTGKFFEKYLPEVKGGLFFSLACQGFMDGSSGDGGRMARLVIDRGFDAYIGAGGKALRIYSMMLMGFTTEKLCEKKTEDELYDIEEAIATAINKIGIHDKVLFKDGEAVHYNIKEGPKNPYTKKPFRLVPDMNKVVYDIHDLDGLPIEGATVTMTVKNYKHQMATYSISTGWDAQGEWVDTIEIPEMDWGYHQVDISADHFAPVSDQFNVVEKGETSKSYTLKLLGECTGRVTDKETGKPLSGVLITAVSPRDDHIHGVYTDSEGQYKIGALDCGPWTLTFSMSGYKDGKLIRILSAKNWQVTAPIALKPMKERIDLFPYLRTPMLDFASKFKLKEWQPDDPDDFGGWELTYKNKYMSVSLYNESSMVKPTPIEIIQLETDPNGLYCIDGFYLGMTEAEVKKDLSQKTWKKDLEGDYNGLHRVRYVRGAYDIEFYYQGNVVKSMECSYSPLNDK